MNILKILGIHTNHLLRNFYQQISHYFLFVVNWPLSSFPCLTSQMKNCKSVPGAMSGNLHLQRIKPMERSRTGNTRPKCSLNGYIVQGLTFPTIILSVFSGSQVRAFVTIHFSCMQCNNFQNVWLLKWSAMHWKKGAVKAKSGGIFGKTSNKFSDPDNTAASVIFDSLPRQNGRFIYTFTAFIEDAVCCTRFPWAASRGKPDLRRCSSIGARTVRNPSPVESYRRHWNAVNRSYRMISFFDNVILLDASYPF